MTVGRTQVGRADRIGQVRCECVEVLASILAEREPFRVQLGNRSDEFAIHALDSMDWCRLRTIVAFATNPKRYSPEYFFDTKCASGAYNLSFLQQPS